MLRISLAGPDRERYGLPEWIEYDSGRPLLSEIRALKTAVGIGWAALERMLWGQWDASGQQTAPPDPDDRLAGLGIVVWLAVRRHRPDLAWDDFDCDLMGIGFESAPDPNRQAPTTGACPD